MATTSCARFQPLRSAARRTVLERVHAEVAAPARERSRERIGLGFGSDDDLAPGHRRIALELPRKRVRTRPGGHDWKTWRRLWGDFPASGELQRDGS